MSSTAHTASHTESRALRRALGRFATGITVVTTCLPDGRRAGLTVNSFNSVSLAPPLVLWSLGVTSPSHVLFEEASHFAVNVLSAGQRAVSQKFASSGGDKFHGVSLTEGLHGCPLLADCCAWFECKVVARYPGGDHTIFIGEVEKFRDDVTREPLVYFGGEYCFVTQAQTKDAP
jgi:flavin reductase (DIM6/NTAB) family NADH-FMN oxidoreductase RutF